jgi:hypothetical protein
MVKMKVGGQPIIFMVDTGADHSVVTKPVAPLTEHRAVIVGATSTPELPELPGSSADLGHAS